MWHLYGHSHGLLPGYGKSLDVGVDCGAFRPLSFEELKALMEVREIGKAPQFPNYTPAVGSSNETVDSPNETLHKPTEFIPSDLQDLFALCRENRGGFDVYNSTVIALIERVSSLEHRLKRI